MRTNLFIWLWTRLPGRRSEAFERFRAHIQGDRAEVSEAGPEALAAMSARERRAAENMLLRAPADARVIEALGVLATRRAVRRLAATFEREQAPGGDGKLLIAAAAALWRLGPHEAYVRVVAARLRCAPGRGERMDAANALAGMAGEEANEALLDALEDCDALVRHFAARALLEIHGVTFDARALRHVLYRAAERRERGRRAAPAASG